MTRKRHAGVTLIELVVAICIMAILFTLTLPAYLRQLRDTRRSIGGAALLEVVMRQEQFFLDHKRYAESLTELAYPAHPYAIDAHGGVVSGQADNRIYLIELATRTNAYTVIATPQLDQAADQSCGTLSLQSNGAKRATGKGDRSCW
jgi:prepilin-type N-terminal cleavage/methylation domain-containing protein